jgi:putative heme-binding domain-containing protein
MGYQKYLQYMFLLIGATLCTGLQGATSTDDLPRGEQLYLIHCASCHGPKGEGGRGPRLAIPKLARAPNEEVLVDVIRQGIPGTEMVAARLNNDEIRQVAAWVLRLGQTERPQIADDVARGERLYYSKGKCAQCHTINSLGGVLGPDLTDIGNRRAPAHLRRSLLEPEAEVPENFSQYRWVTHIPDNFLQIRVITKDGRRLTGVRLNEDPFSIQLRDFSGNVHSFFKSELEELHKDWGKSPMPSYRGVFTSEELDDLVGFLASLRGGK